MLGQTSLLDPADACAVAADTNPVVPPDPCTPTGHQGPPGHLCFITTSGMRLVVITAPSIMRSIWYCQTSLASLGLSYSSDGLVDFTLPLTESVNCAVVIIVDL